jgi:hypothetical protein
MGSLPLETVKALAAHDAVLGLPLSCARAVLGGMNRVGQRGQEGWQLCLMVLRSENQTWQIRSRL